jgi:N-acetyl sugar amidotransferase
MYFKQMKYCSKCVYPIVAAHLEITDGVCSACKSQSEFQNLTDAEWDNRAKKFDKLIEGYRDDKKSKYDCIIPVSGGKDSFYQTHVMVEKYKLKPLLVTYHGNNYLPEGDYNRELMRNAFNADHLVFGPSVEVLKKLNRIGFKMMGDMNWHAHCGIYTYPIKVAAMMDIPLVIWGEMFWDISGMFSADDYVEFSARTRHEHALRGFEWYDMVGQEGLTESDLDWAKYPTDSEILKSGIRGVCIGNYFKWDPNEQTKLVIDKYGWKASDREFQRTYRKMSNLDDRYENGAHDLLKFIKFGYGRGSDHASKDIRTGYMTRAEGIEMVRKYDHVVSDDLYYWLEYVNMSEEEFWSTADTFRDTRVWWIENGEWWKDNVWGEPSSYGKVRLEKSKWGKYKKSEEGA